MNADAELRATERLRARARLRILRLPGSRELSTVEDVENRTDMADARIALCVAVGVDLDDIDPGSGHNKSRSAYEQSRVSWVRYIEMWGFSEVYDRPRLVEVLRRWTSWDPAYTEKDDWIAAGRAAHDARQARLQQPCDRESCDLHRDRVEAAPIREQTVVHAEPLFELSPLHEAA